MSARTPAQAQGGAATLLLVLGLVLLATLASAYGSRAVLGELLSSEAMAQASRARLAAQAALATAEAQLLALAASPLDNAPYARQIAACPGDLNGRQWQCAALALDNAGDAQTWQYSALLARDTLASPHVWQIRALATGTRTPIQAALQQSVFMPVMPPAPDDAPNAALVLNGCASEAAGSHWQICPLNATGTACSGPATGDAVFSHFVPDGDRNGSISPGERQACLTFAASSLPAAGTQNSPDRPASRSPCNRAAWRSVLGAITPEQLQAWSAAQEQQGLHSLSVPARTIYWVDSPSDWTQSLGSADAPVLLVFSALACAVRCPRIAAGAHIHGTVYADAGCDDDRMRGWQAGWVEGQVVVEAGLPQVMSNSQIWARASGRAAYRLHWPAGIDPAQVQRVPGSQWSVTP